MKKIVLAVSLIIASVVNVFSQDVYVLSNYTKNFLETYNININDLKFIDSVPDMNMFFEDKINHSGDENAFAGDVESNLWFFKDVNFIGFESINVSEFSNIIKKVELIKFRDKNAIHDFMIYLVYQDVYGVWYSENTLILQQ